MRVAILNGCGRQMKKPVLESRMFSRVNKEHLDDILASAGNATEKLVDVVVGDEEETEETSDDDEVVSVADDGVLKHVIGCV